MEETWSAVESGEKRRGKGSRMQGNLGDDEQTLLSFFSFPVLSSFTCQITDSRKTRYWTYFYRQTGKVRRIEERNESTSHGQLHSYSHKVKQ